ncbi:hypothetical protein [Sphingomonas xinjiangensis]|uniref:Uncharacterized protein n=1 Tax=Sphingomonas xinjiangensis TaxID=643568 RepID=A0A840YTN4_9SPHN|nr:hypothetical protein [Sphingomonas xinjiangensis]MBB5712997.1 hypothetical protein [Sphingomonas xinjiangensis]
MWSAFKVLASRIGLTAEQVAEVQRNEGDSIVQDPLHPEIGYMVRPDPDWTARMGEAWNGTLANSRRESAGTIPIEDGLLSVAEADTPGNSVTAVVVPGSYEVTFTVAHMGAEETYDYLEYVSHAFVLLEGRRNVALIEPLADENGVELGLNASWVAFARAEVLQEIAGDHFGRWTLRIGDLMYRKSAEGVVSSLTSIKIENDDKSGSAIILKSGHGRGNYSLFRIADVNGNNVGIMVDFFIDNRPW